MTTKKKLDGVNEVSSFSIENPDMEVFNALPEWLQAKIEDAPEWEDTEEEEAAAAPATKTATKKAAKTEEPEEDEIDIADVPF